jgi:CelD/BcsL family acetyltransferase involved in cellulose biosynthesis
MIPSTIGVKYDTVTTVVPQDTLKMFVGEEVLELLLDEQFQASWDDLYERCRWATVFQSRPFVATWYQMYQNEYLPITFTYEFQGKLKGLLTLVKDKSGLISGAGKNNAEYQVWLSTETDSGHFIAGALLEVKKRFPKSSIQFKYIPGDVSLAWLENDKVWRRHCLVEVVKQPILKINEVSLNNNELKKKHHKYKINRLKKLGELRFERITDAQVFASVFDELALQYDFRKSAMYNITFFRNGVLAKEFFLSLFEKNLLHVTALKLNDEIIASTIGTIGKNKCMHFTGINTHSFFYAKSSPGILQLLMLSKLLAEEGIEIFDLTPGTDYYKESLANEYAIVYKLTIDTAYKQVLKKMGFALSDFSKKSATALGIKRSLLKKIKWQFSLFKLKIKSHLI